MINRINKSKNRIMQTPFWIRGKLLLLVLALNACNLPVSSMGSTSSGESDASLPVISNLTISSEGVFYNDADCGPTTLTVTVDVENDINQIRNVGIQYRYNDYGQTGKPADPWRNVTLPSTGDGRYAGLIDIAFGAATALGGVSGSFEYQAYAIDNAGNVQTMPSEKAYSLAVHSCNSGSISSLPNSTENDGTSDPGIAAPPPQPESSSSGDSSIEPSPTPQSQADSSGGDSDSVPSPTPQSQADSSDGDGSSGPSPTPDAQVDMFIGGTVQDATPDPIYYGQCSNNEPTNTTVQASIDPENSGEISVSLHYRFMSNSGNVGTLYKAAMMKGQGNAYHGKTNLVGSEAENLLAGEDGLLKYWLEVTDSDGKIIYSQTDYVNYVYVSPCSVLGNAMTPPTINYFIGPTNAHEGDSVTVEWDVSGADCGVTLDGASVNPTGSIQYVIQGGSAPMTITHALLAQGGDCSNPIPASDIVEISVDLQLSTLYAPIVLSGFVDVTDGNTWNGGISVGDDQYDHLLQGFVRFDISGLPKDLHQLQSAILDLGGCNSYGYPELTQPFQLSITQGIGTATIGTLSECTGQFDVSGAIYKSLGEDVVQIMIMPTQVFENGVADQIIYSPRLTITYIPGP